ncbi:MAG: condensation domain-containing protein [Smithella sp.]|jgi:hypothetical protein
MLKRKLGLTEFYSKFCHDHAGGTTLLSGMIRVQGPLSSALAEKALHMMQKRHAVLRSYFTESSREGDYLAVDETPGILPFTILPHEGEEHWKEVIEKSSMNMFSEKDRYLWRVVFLGGSGVSNGLHEMIVTFHHAIADGISIESFFGQFLEYCRLVFNDTTPEIDTLPLIPSVEELLVKKISWGGFLFSMISSSIKLIKYRKHLNRYERFVPLHERRPRNIYREINDIQSLNLNTLCRENNTTLTGLLSAVLTKSVYNVKKNSNTKAVQLLITPVNVRERCNPVVDKEHIGCFVDFIESTLAFDNDTPLWELARSYKKQLMDGIEYGGHMPTYYSKPLAMNIFSNMGKGMLKNVFQYGIGVTNIGRVNLKAHSEPFSVDYFSFCTGRQWGDWMILLHTATVENTLYFCFCFAEPLISREAVDLIADQVVSQLSSMNSNAISQGVAKQ